MAKDQASSLAFGLTCQWVSVQNVSQNGKESIHSHKQYPILWPLENWENSGRFRGSNHLGGAIVHRLSQDNWLWKFGLGADQSSFIKTNRLQCLGVLHPLLVLPEFGKNATYFANWAIVFGPRFTSRWLRAIPLGLSAGLMLQGKGSGWIIDITNFRPLVILRWMLIYVNHCLWWHSPVRWLQLTIRHKPFLASFFIFPWYSHDIPVIFPLPSGELT
jgi:hypothetical protein